MRAVLLAAVLALPASAQERTAAEHRNLLELAAVLGEAHALRTLCDGRKDQSWRNRMARVAELEGADGAFRERLTEGFNTGYLRAQAAHGACDATAQAEIRAVARRGRDLAAVLSGGRFETASAR